jgi:hypothetical protein
MRNLPPPERTFMTFRIFYFIFVVGHFRHPGYTDVCVWIMQDPQHSWQFTGEFRMSAELSVLRLDFSPYYVIKHIFVPRNESDTRPHRLSSKTIFYKIFIKKNLSTGNPDSLYSTLHISRTAFYMSKMSLRHKDDSSMHKCTCTLKSCLGHESVWCGCGVVSRGHAETRGRHLQEGPNFSRQRRLSNIFWWAWSHRFINYKSIKVILGVLFKQCCGSESVIKWPSGSGSLLLLYIKDLKKFQNFLRLRSFCLLLF